MIDTTATNWRETTKGLIEKLAKERKIAPADVMTLMRFAVMGDAALRAEHEEKPERLQAVG